MTLAVINYGLGNVGAFETIYRRADIHAKVAVSAADLGDDVTKLILPGVGSFDYALTLFRNSGMADRIIDLVENAKIPILGVCVGMQIMCESSDEGQLSGLGWAAATVRHLNDAHKSNHLPCPHMGWNDVDSVRDCDLFTDLEHGSQFYFLHSYFVDCKDQNSVVASANYGFDFCCGFQFNNVYGVQFHPEKGHNWGTKLLLNFAAL